MIKIILDFHSTLVCQKAVTLKLSGQVSLPAVWKPVHADSFQVIFCKFNVNCCIHAE